MGQGTKPVCVGSMELRRLAIHSACGTDRGPHRQVFVCGVVTPTGIRSFAH